MPFIFTDQPNKLKLNDHLSNSSIELFYRTPSAKEQASYVNGMTRRERNKLVNCTGEQRQKMGAEILTGFREGDFEKPGGVVISSDPASPNFDKEWKQLVCKYAPHLVEALAIHAFEQTASVDEGEDLEGA